MPIFHSLKEIEEEFYKRSEDPVNDVAADIYGKFNKNIFKFYDDEVFYNSPPSEPYEYIRTKQLPKSLVGKPAVRGSGGLNAEVYFDSSKMTYDKNPVGKSGKVHSADLSSEEVLGLAMSGSHGGYADGTEIWFDTIEEIGDVELSIAKALITAGIPISKG